MVSREIRTVGQSLNHWLRIGYLSEQYRGLGYLHVSGMLYGLIFVLNSLPQSRGRGSEIEVGLNNVVWIQVATRSITKRNLFRRPVTYELL